MSDELNIEDFTPVPKKKPTNTARRGLATPDPEHVKKIYSVERVPTTSANSVNDTHTEDHRAPSRTGQTEQISLRGPAELIERFKKTARKRRLSQPQLLQVLLEMYDAHPNPEHIEDVTIENW